MQDELVTAKGEARAATPARTLVPRAAPRRKVFRPVWLDTGSGRHRAHILNLSAIGACVHARAVHRVWSGVTLQIGEQGIAGRITWADGERCGVKFARALSPAELDALTD